jgi:hypothetical protein
VRTLADMVRDTPPAAAEDLIETATTRTFAREETRLAPRKPETQDAPARSLPRAYTPDVRAHLWSAPAGRGEPIERARGNDGVRPPRVKGPKAATAPAPSRERPKAAVLLRRG